MLDPFSALAVACAVIQFLDFSASFLKDVYKIRKSPHQSLAYVQDLENAANSLRQKVEDQKLEQQNSGTPQTHAEKALQLFNERCMVFADSLESAVQDVKPGKGHGLGKSMKIALNAGRKQDEFKKLQAALQNLNVEFVTHLLSLLSKSTIRPRPKQKEKVCSHCSFVYDEVLQVPILLRNLANVRPR